jgi:hypothetical protein
MLVHGEVAPVDLAAVGAVEAAEEVQQRALPRARGAEDRYHLALVQRQGRTSKHRHIAARSLEAPHQIAGRKWLTHGVTIMAS